MIEQMKNGNAVSEQPRLPAQNAENGTGHDSDDEEQNHLMKTSILSHLKSYGIKKVVAYYSGYGDSGSVDDIQMTNAQEGNDRTAITDKRLAEDIENFCLEELEDRVEGWEIDDGSDGSFTFDVDVGTITCSHEHHFMDSYNESWEV